MLETTCPTCGQRVQVDQSTPCPNCRGAIAAFAPVQPLASTTTAIATPEHAVQAKIGGSDTSFRDGPPPQPLSPPSIRRDLFSWVRHPATVILAAVIGITLAGLIVPKVQEARAQALRAQSINNLKEIGLAFHSFHDVNKRLPFNGTVRAKAGDNTSGSWAFQILPFLEQQRLFDRPVTHVGVAMYMCPGRGRPDVSDTGAWTDYFINPWINDSPVNGFQDGPDSKRTLVGITDGTSNTILLGQGNIDPDLYSSRVAIAQSIDIFKGGNPAMTRRSTTNRADKSGDMGLNWGGPFPEGCLFCMGDATVRMFPYALTGGRIVNGIGEFDCSGRSKFLASFLTPCGGEICEGPDM